MKLSQMTARVAEVFEMPEAEVSGYARNLREEGLIASGGRGPGGANMQKNDLINLVMGVLGSQFSKNAAAFVRELKRSRRGKPAILGEAPKADFLDKENLADCLYCLAEGAHVNGDFFSWMMEPHPDAPILPNCVEVDFYVDKAQVRVRVERVTILHDLNGMRAHFDTTRFGFRTGLWKSEIDGKEAASAAGMTSIRRIDYSVLAILHDIMCELEVDRP